MRRTNLYVFLIGTAILLMLASCAGSVKRIDLSYTPDQIGPFPKANAVQEVIINKFRDSRTERQIGGALNYEGTVFYTVEANNDVSAWVTGALAAELGNAGFKVVLGEDLSDPEKFVVAGNVADVSAWGVLGNMRVTIQVMKGFKTLLNQTYNAAGKVPSDNVYLTNYVKLYDLTLQDLLRKAIPQIIAAMNQAP